MDSIKLISVADYNLEYLNKNGCMLEALESETKAV